MKNRFYHSANVNHNISIDNLNTLYNIVNSISVIPKDLNEATSFDEVHYLSDKLHEKVNCIYNIILK